MIIIIYHKSIYVFQARCKNRPKETGVGHSLLYAYKIPQGKNTIVKFYCILLIVIIQWHNMLSQPDSGSKKMNVSVRLGRESSGIFSWLGFFWFFLIGYDVLSITWSVIGILFLSGPNPNAVIVRLTTKPVAAFILGLSGEAHKVLIIKRRKSGVI